MATMNQLKSIEKLIKDKAPERMQAAIAQAFRDMGSQKLTPDEALNEIQRIKEVARK